MLRISETGGSTFNPFSKNLNAFYCTLNGGNIKPAINGNFIAQEVKCFLDNATTLKTITPQKLKRFKDSLI